MRSTLEQHKQPPVIQARARGRRVAEVDELSRFVAHFLSARLSESTKTRFYQLRFFESPWLYIIARIQAIATDTEAD